MVMIRSTNFCEDENCKVHVHERDYPVKLLVITDDQAKPLALVDDEEVQA
jgi:hypothetical protein